MTLFAVFKQGVQRQECGGIFSTQALAEAAAMQLLAGERDDYHSYDVVPFELDVRTPQTAKERPIEDRPGEYWSGGALDEPTRVAYFSRRRPHQ